ncbi:MAG: hypothetical protein CM15mP73_5100 [Hyphomicrobiales bacterium]|nr:MAG: hypothetical protein CM15mP73_5100 [Hyphomicrobiales bacterium]
MKVLEYGSKQAKRLHYNIKRSTKRKEVFDLLPSNIDHLIPIGRLDLNTEGLLIFTNNGDFSRYMEHPKIK